MVCNMLELLISITDLKATTAIEEYMRFDVELGMKDFLYGLHLYER